jgi:sugar lactone lactonase YvrE
VARHQGDVVVSNSIAISPDRRTLYFSDTRRFVMWAFDFDEERGVLSNRRVFVDHSAARDRPDGACVDEEGCVWVAMFAGKRIVRYRPDGTLDRTIEVPVTNPTCVCFGGADLATLYITTARKFLSPAQLEAEPLAGALLAVEPGVRGLPEAQFAG